MICIRMIMLLSIFGLCYSSIADIKGYVYYQDYNEPYMYYFGSDSVLGCLAFPIHEAIVTLYKRNAYNEWEQYGPSVLTDEGYYVFEDVNVGRNQQDLCTYSDWFRIEFDANDQLPEDWYYFDVLNRFSNNSPRPAGLSDAGDVRVDCIFEASQWNVYEGHSLQADAISGHWVSHSGETAYSLTFGNGEATCPIDSNAISVGNCFMSHWNNTICFTTWDEVKDYSQYVFWPIGGDESDAIGWFYCYWSVDWPNYAMHCHRPTSNLMIIVDFINP